ncbi:MAG: hypothetical protein R3B70_07150 [Polyangiaceae bacterium]
MAFAVGCVRPMQPAALKMLAAVRAGAVRALPDPLQVSPQAVAEVSVALEERHGQAREAAGAA